MYDLPKQNVEEKTKNAAHRDESSVLKCKYLCILRVSTINSNK